MADTITIDVSKAIKGLDFGTLTANKDLLNLIALGAYGAAKYFESEGGEVIVKDFKALAKAINEVIL